MIQKAEEIELGWDSTKHKLKISYIDERNTVRMNKIGDNNHNLPGPEIDLENVPQLIEALIKIYNSQRQREKETNAT